MSEVVYFGGPIFDGTCLQSGYLARFKDGRLIGIEPLRGGDIFGQDWIDLNGDILSPGYVDLQVNGGGGVMFNNAPEVATLRRMANAHRQLGARAILPTLITDTPDVTNAAIAAVVRAVQEKVPGIAGLHLEGPHLSIAKKGAHDERLIRPMTQADLETLQEAANALPVLMVTMAPESVTTGQVAALVEAGVKVSLGHTDADFDTCQSYFDAGASCVTHLFNAMSGLNHRSPGLVGAALARRGVDFGLIADGIHVHPAAMKLVWSAQRETRQVYLVSDAMAVAGTSETSFYLNGRKILRKNGQLTLVDGTLAGADLDLTRAIRVLVEEVGVDLEEALYAGVTKPASMVFGDEASALGLPLTDFNRISADLSGCEMLG